MLQHIIYNKRHQLICQCLLFRDSAAIRTRDLLLRRQLLYPAELRNLYPFHNHLIIKYLLQMIMFLFDVANIHFFYLFYQKIKIKL